MTQIPHLRIVVAVSAFVLIGFLGVSIYVLGFTNDEVTKGNIVGTWVNFGVLTVGFWIGSSSGGKSKSEEPQPVTVTNPPDAPIPTTDIPEPAFAKFEEPKP